MRRAAAAAASVGLLAAAGCSGESAAGGSPAGGPTAAPAATAELPPFTEPGDGGAVEVVDSGMSVHVDDGGDGWLGYGFVVENTSALVATQTDIRVDIFDESGELIGVGGRGFYVGDGVSGRDETDPARVRVLLPGQRFGSGDLVDLPGTTPARIEVAVSGSLWYPRDTPSVEFATITAGEVTTEPDAAGGCLDLAVTYTLDSAYESDQRVRVHSVLRDGEGAIIGGTHPRWDSDVTAAPGASSHERSLQSSECLPGGLGDAHDEVVPELYVDPWSVVRAEPDGVD